MRILLVDDDTSVIQALLAILKTLPGHDIRVATSGDKALENAAALGGVDLLISDVVMDPMDGFTLCGRLMELYPQMRTIFISGYDLSEYGDSLQHYQLLQKPIAAEALLAAVQKEIAPPAPVAVAVAVPAATPVAVAKPVAAAVPQARAATPVAVAQPKATPVAVAKAATPVAVAAAPKAAVAVAKPAAVPAAVPQARAATPVVATPAAVPAAPTAVPATPAATPAPQPAAAAPQAAPKEIPIDEPLTDSDSSAGLIGHMIGGYQIVTQLGEGRWGTVYAAVQTSINRPVGLKVLDPVRARDENQKQRFIADARAKANVQHPSILAVYEAGAANGWIFYTHEYVDGHNLTELAQAGRQLDEILILKVLRVVAEGYLYLNRNNITHSPLDGSSIYLSMDNQPRLANLATTQPDVTPVTENELRALGQALLPLAPVTGISTGLRALLTRLAQGGPGGFNAWGPLLQAVKALEPKIIPTEAAKISAQDRAAEAAIEAARRQQKRSMILNLASIGTLLILAIGLIYWKYGPTNERDLDAQIEIPAGEFLFADGRTESTGQFWIDQYEVTIGQYAKFVEFIEKHPEREKDYDHPQQPPTVLTHIPQNWHIWYENAKRGTAARGVKMSLNSPMLEVSWWDAYAYAKWRGRELPTEKEWEKAARGTRGFQYPWGDEAKNKNANTGADHVYRDPKQKGKVDGYNFWNDVDAQEDDKSPYGVIGMAGNVSEWTADWTPDNKFPIIKGGNYSQPLKSAAERIDNKEPGTIAEWIGFRTVSRTPPAAEAK